jgi:hypothetical protein
MALRERIAGWLSAWKYVLILGAALAASLYANYWQHRQALTAPLREQTRELREAIQIRDQVAADRGRDDTALLDELRGIADRARPVRIQYLAAAAAAPLAPNCAPGQARMDAVNAGADP